jgi:hypothetical protein
MTEVNNTATEVAASGTPEVEAAPNLGLEDFEFILNYFDVTAKRGAVHANEMTTVGFRHDRILKFTTTWRENLKAQEEAAAAAAEAAEPKATEEAPKKKQKKA